MLSLLRKLWYPRRLWLPPADRRGAFRFSVGCCCVGCAACLRGEHPEALIVEFTGIGNAACNNCTSLNGVAWTVDFVHCLTIEAVGGGTRYVARWQADFTDTHLCSNIAAGRYLRVRVTIGWNVDDSQRDITVLATWVTASTGQEDAGTIVAEYEIIEVADEQFDCINFADFDVPVLTTGSEGHCTFFSGSTCAVTAA